MGALGSLVVLLCATAWGWSQSARRNGRLVPSIVLVVAAAQWLLDPVHTPALVTLDATHGLTPGDLLVLPAVAAFVRLVRPIRV